jgi:hypothetical protein
MSASCNSDRLCHRRVVRPSKADHAPVRVLTHSKRLDDCFGDFLVRVVCECGACREIQPQALARLVGWKVRLRELALQMRCSSHANPFATHREAAAAVQHRAPEPAMDKSQTMSVK